MSMDLFRKNQKLIFWIVSLIIIPSFVLVWGGADRYGGNQYTDLQVGTIDGKNIEYSDFEKFQKRIHAAIGGLPLQFTNAPGAGTPSENIYKFLCVYSLLQDAENAGFAASDLQIGTYIMNGHPALANIADKSNPQSRERAVDDFCRQMQITRAEFLRGVQEWQTIGNYLQADANISAINDDTVFAYYSLNQAEVVVKRLRFPESQAVTDLAKKEIMALPEAELEQKAREFALTHSDYPTFREPSRWRFAWVLSPFVANDSVQEPSEAEIRNRYESDKATFYLNSPLSDVHALIKAQLTQEEVERQTTRNFSVDIDPQLRMVTKDIDFAEFVKLAKIAKYGVKAGDTGVELLSADELLKVLPKVSNFDMKTLLNSIDLEDNMANRDDVIAEWKKGFNLTGRPFNGEDGLFRLQLLEYQPSVPAQLDDANGKLKPEFLSSAVAGMVGERVSEMVRRNAEETESKIREYMIAKEQGNAVPDSDVAQEFEDLPSDTISYVQLSDSDYTLGRLPIGDMMGPKLYVEANGDTGLELMVIVGRKVPTRETFAAESEETKNRYRQFVGSNFQGNFGFTFTLNGPAAIIQPSPAILGGLSARLSKGDLQINPELVRYNEG